MAGMWLGRAGLRAKCAACVLPFPFLLPRPTGASDSGMTAAAVATAEATPGAPVRFCRLGAWRLGLGAGRGGVLVVVRPRALLGSSAHVRAWLGDAVRACNKGVSVSRLAK